MNTTLWLEAIKTELKPLPAEEAIEAIANITTALDEMREELELEILNKENHLNNE